MDVDVNFKFQVPLSVSVDENTYRLSKLCLDVTHKYEEDVDAVVSQLCNMKIRPPPVYDDPFNITDNYQEREVLKLFKNLKI